MNNALILLLLLSMAGCSQKSQPVEPGIQHPAATPKPAESPDLQKSPAFRGTLRELLQNVAREQYPDSANLYIPPPDGMEGHFYVQVHQEPAILLLADNVSAYTAGDNILAVGFSSGEIRVFGPNPCPSLFLPGGKSGVGLLDWHPDSPFLLAANEERKEANIFDLRKCAQIGERSFNSTLLLGSISPRGAWLGLIDQTQTLWVGPAAGGPLTKVAALRYPPLALAFSPQEGLLLTVDQAGWLTIWAPMTKKLVSQTLIPSGPFASASFDGHFVDLAQAGQGQKLRFDLVAKKLVPLENIGTPFQLKNGVLSYQTWKNRLVKKAHMQPPCLEVWFSSKDKAFLVRDLDGESRGYGLDGTLLPTVPGGEGLTPVPVDEDARFEHKGHKYALAERMFQKEHHQLNCRFIPGKGFFLWWRKAPRPMEFNPRPNFLPVRQGILAEEGVTWNPLEPSDQLL